MKINGVIVGSIVLVSVLGCGNNTGTQTNPENPPGPPTLNGAWERPSCVNRVREAIIVDNDRVELNRLSYSDNACTESAAQARYTLSIRRDEASKIVDQAHELDLRVDTVNLICPSVAWANVWNEQKMCGFSDWHEFDSKDVAGKNCAGSAFPKIGDSRYSVYRLKQDNTMELAALSADPTMGHKTLDGALSYKKVILK